jgi:hypothetical protein
MKPFYIHDQHYTEFFAWWPTRVSSGAWVWLDPYYMQPNSNGYGITYTFDEVLRITSH